MRSVKISHVVYTLCVGSFAGLLWVFELAILPALAQLSASEYTVMEKMLIEYIDTNFLNAIIVANVAMFLPLYPLIRYRKQRQTRFWKLTAAGWLLFFFGVGVFTIALNVPINEYVMSWDAANPPSDWMEARDRWALLNHIRTPINYISFILLIVAGFYITELENNVNRRRESKAEPALG